jgi:LPXTG-site transpeptidase (sortase) family protein
MRKIVSMILCLALTAALAIPALAVDSYHFKTGNTEEFYVPQWTHGSDLGMAILAPELETRYGLGSAVPANAPVSQAATVGAATRAGYGLPSDSGAVFYPEASIAAPYIQPVPPPMTPTSEVRQKDGSIGTLTIPAIGLTVQAYDGDLTAAMRKGLGHMDSTSAWTGNVGLVGHNRGSWAHFAKLKDLRVGEAVTYKTSLGTRTYTVTFVGKIAANDWSYLQPTADNRITMITCIADQPEVRLCVQAVGT